MKYTIILGHGKSKNGRYNDSGAVGFGHVERDLLRGEFLVSLKKYIALSQHDFTVYENNAYRDQYVNTLVNQDNITELHMDGNSNPDFKGGHVIIHQDFKPDETDKKLSYVIQSLFGFRVNCNKQNGINGRSDLQNCNQAKRKNITYRLLELGHITNKANHDTFIFYSDKLAKQIIETLTGENLSNTCPTCGQTIK